MHRRAFLRPQHLACSAARLYAALHDSQPSAAETSGAPALLRFARRAMATTFEIVLPYGTPLAHQAAAAALDEIDSLESQLTVYRDDSEVSLLNERAALEDTPVEPRLFELLELSARLTKETDGAFDITAGALIKAWGFYQGPRRVPTKAERAEALQRTGMHHVVLNAAQRTVRYLRPGLEINLGSIGKGYALDRAAELLRCEFNITSALLHGGHSSVYAIGTAPGKDHGWPVGITHPCDPERRLTIVHLKDRALGTSAATYRHLEWMGRKLGHILDPRRGWPAESMASASALAPTAAEADALATAFFILGTEKAEKILATRTELEAVLLAASG